MGTRQVLLGLGRFHAEEGRHEEELSSDLAMNVVGEAVAAVEVSEAKDAADQGRKAEATAEAETEAEVATEAMRQADGDQGWTVVRAKKQ